MFKMTKDDLAMKTDAQLTALFQKANLGLNAKGSSLQQAQALLMMIRAEMRQRGPRH